MMLSVPAGMFAAPTARVAIGPAVAALVQFTTPADKVHPAAGEVSAKFEALVPVIDKAPVNGPPAGLVVKLMVPTT